MTIRSDEAQPQSPSPLDGHLRRFLGFLDGLATGFGPTTDQAAAATACDVSVPFVEVLFTSARIRGLIEPFQPRGARGRYRWRVSPRGDRWQSAPDAEP